MDWYVNLKMVLTKFRYRVDFGNNTMIKFIIKRQAKHRMANWTSKQIHKSEVLLLLFHGIS